MLFDKLSSSFFTPSTGNTQATPVNTQATPVNTKGYFSTQPESMENYFSLLKKVDKFQSISTNGEAISKNSTLSDIYAAIESGVAIPSSPKEVRSVFSTKIQSEIAKTLKNDTTLPKDFAQDIMTELENAPDSQEAFNKIKNNLNAVFKKDPHLLFEKAADYPETVRRLVKLLDLPVQNNKGWNLASQAAKTGNPKLAAAFKKAGFGPNLHTKAVVDFAQAMTDDAPNAQKSAALKELLGITPLS